VTIHDARTDRGVAFPPMRYFRRAGPDVLIFETEGRERFIRGPQQASEENPEGVPGETTAYEEGDPWGDRMIEQLTNDPYWYEVDARGDTIVPTEPEPEPEVTTDTAPTTDDTAATADEAAPEATSEETA
jgi:hypothetical protein